MQAKIVLCFTVALLYSIKIKANPKLQLYASKLQFSIGAGYRLSTDFNVGKLSDYLIPYKKNTFYFNPFSITFFPVKRWGVSMSLEVGYGEGGAQRRKNFQKQISNRYSEEFYIKYQDYTTTSLSAFGIMLGIVKRSEIGRFKVNIGPRLGMYSFSNNSEIIYLKKKNSNDIQSISIRGKKPASDCFAIGVSGKIIYALSRHIGIHAEIMPTYTFSNFEFSEMHKDLNTSEKTEIIIPYNKNAVALNMSFGIVILRNVPR